MIITPRRFRTSGEKGHIFCARLFFSEEQLDRSSSLLNTRTSGLPIKQNTILNSRQQNILFLVCKGLRNAEVARQLGLSERTVKGYVSQLFLIFEVTNRTELAGRVAIETAEAMLAEGPSRC